MVEVRLVAPGIYNYFWLFAFPYKFQIWLVKTHQNKQTESLLRFLLRLHEYLDQFKENYILVHECVVFLHLYI